MQIPRAVWCAWWLVLAGCASTHAVKKDAAPDGSEENDDARHRRERLGAVLLDCARLTFAGNETPLQLHLYVVNGEARALEVLDVNGAPTALLCPGDRDGVPQVLGSGDGKSWGTPPPQAMLVDVWCAPGLDGSGGRCTRNDARYTNKPAAPLDAASYVPTSDGPPTPRATDPRRYEVAFASVTPNLLAQDKMDRTKGQLLQFGTALQLCFTSLQPDIPKDSTVGVTVKMGYLGGETGMDYRMLPGAALPAHVPHEVWRCVNEVASTYEEAANSVDVKYVVSVSAANGPVGAAVQSVSFAAGDHQMGMSATAPARNEYARKLAAALEKCAGREPIIVRDAHRGADVQVEVRGTVDARHPDVVRVMTLEEVLVGGAELSKCTLELLPPPADGTAARATWHYTVHVEPR